MENELLPIDVGSRLKQLRIERGQSMRSLARASGLSTNALSMIERSRTSPSVSTLYKLADALEVPITAFFRTEPPRQKIVFRPSGERKNVEFKGGLWQGLGGEEFVGKLEPFIIQLEPGGESGPYGMLHAGDEFVLCLQGRIEYIVEEHRFFLESGDSLIFAAKMHHRWKNIGEDRAIAVIILAGFEQGESPSEYHLTSHKKGDIEDFGS